MSQPAKKGSAGDQGNSNWTDREPSTQAEAAETDADPSLDTSLTDEAREESSQPQYGDRNPNWTDRDLPKQDSQECDTSSKEAVEKQYGDRNPNWQDRELPPPE